MLFILQEKFWPTLGKVLKAKLLRYPVLAMFLGNHFKINELGGKVVTISGPDGYVHDEAGVSGEKSRFPPKNEKLWPRHVKELCGPNSALNILLAKSHGVEKLTCYYALCNTK